MSYWAHKDAVTGQWEKLKLLQITLYTRLLFIFYPYQALWKLYINTLKLFQCSGVLIFLIFFSFRVVCIRLLIEQRGITQLRFYHLNQPELSFLKFYNVNIVDEFISDTWYIQVHLCVQIFFSGFKLKQKSVLEDQIKSMAVQKKEVKVFMI